MFAIEIRASVASETLSGYFPQRCHLPATKIWLDLSPNIGLRTIYMMQGVFVGLNSADSTIACITNPSNAGAVLARHCGPIRGEHNVRTRRRAPRQGMAQAHTCARAAESTSHQVHARPGPCLITLGVAGTHVQHVESSSTRLGCVCSRTARPAQFGGHLWETHNQCVVGRCRYGDILNINRFTSDACCE